MKTLAQPKVARVLFDESHSRGVDHPPRAGGADAARPPRGLLLRARRRRARRPRLRRHRPTPTRPLTRETLAGADVARHRPSLRPQVGGDHQRRPPDPPRRRARRHRRVRPRRRRAHRPRRDRAGQVRQQPERPPRPLRHRGRERHRPGLRAPPQRAPSLGPRRRSTRTASDAAEGRVDLLARVARGLLLPRRHARAPQRRPRPRPHLRHRRPAGRAARRRHTARRRPRRRPRRLRPLRRRLHRRARPRGPLAEPRLLGRPARLRAGRGAVTDSPAAADRHWAALKRRRRGAAR